MTDRIEGLAEQWGATPLYRTTDSARPRRARRTVAPISQPDEFLRRARAADERIAHERAADNTPAGQIPSTITTAFIRLVELLNQHTDGVAELDVVVRDRSTGETAGVLPVTEDMAVALLSAFSATVSQVRPTHAPSPARPALSVLTGGVA